VRGHHHPGSTLAECSEDACDPGDAVAVEALLGLIEDEEVGADAS
jgi:hypothetical protein